MLKIRPMVAADKAAVLTILKSTAEFKPGEVVVAEELLDLYLNNPAESDYYVLIAEEGSSILGYVCYGPTPLTEGTWDVYWIAVAKEKQGQGIGRSLLQSAENEIKKARGRLAVIETSSIPEYAKTRRFYESQRYEFASRIADYYTPGDDQIIYIKRFN